MGMSQKKKDRLGSLFATLHRQSAPTRLILSDPIQFPHRYSDPKDKEIVGWLSATLAYGHIRLFSAVLERLLAVIGPSPYRYLMTFDPKHEHPRFDGVYYRFNTSDDLFALVYLTSEIIQRYASLKTLFLSLDEPSEDSLHATLKRFGQALIKIAEISPYPIRCSRGLRYLLPSVSGQGAYKRMNLYLRWMVRLDDGVDFGLWHDIAPSRLTIPLDTHIIRVSRHLGLTRRKTADWKMAREVTDALRVFSPLDPLKYDFVLCHLGISNKKLSNLFDRFGKEIGVS